ncbi:MAG TPA: SDR family oxidoreductase [Polyangia bacterium]
MKIVVIGGTGRVGSNLVKRLRDGGHDVHAASPASGFDSVTGKGVDTSLAGVDIVVDVTNAPSFEEGAVLSFFESSARHLLPAEARAGVKHHVALSVVGADRMPDIGYMRAKMAQETAIKASPVPYTIVRATQFFEFIGAIADSGAQGNFVRLPSALMQPIAVSDVAALLAEIVVQQPINGTIDIAGPEAMGIDEAARRLLRAKGDPRQVQADPQARYFGGKVDDRTLTPGARPLIGPTRFADWLSQVAAS